MSVNNQGILHAVLNGQCLCKSRSAHMGASIGEFCTTARKCVRCDNKLAKMDARALRTFAASHGFPATVNGDGSVIVCGQRVTTLEQLKAVIF